MSSTIGRTAGVCLTAVMLAACVSPSPYLDSQFGAAVELNKAMQTRDPDAGSKHPAPDGMDGVAANDTIDRYQKTYRDPPPQPNIFTIGVGTAGGAR